MIDYRQDGAVAHIRLDTPETGNRFTYRLMLDFIAALERAASDGAHVLLLDAAGDDFTFGRDQQERLENVSRHESLGLILRANAALQRFPGVSVALINGHALGFGSGLSLHSTISIAADDAVLGFDEIAHNLAPLVVVAYLPHFVGPRVAEELTLTGRHVRAEEAQRLGLVTRVVPAAQLRAAGEEVVASLRARPAGALRQIRRFARAGQGVGGYPSEERLQQGVDELVAWLEAGRP
jgi:enoyl-CoA hydratase/carnithine racemase